MDWEQRGIVTFRRRDGEGVGGTQAGLGSPLNAMTHHRTCPRRTREVSEAGLLQLQHHLTKATEKSANRHVHQAMLVLQHMLGQH